MTLPAPPPGSVPPGPDNSRDADWLEAFGSAPEVQAVFRDPRYRHLAAFGDLDDRDAEHLNYDRALSLQALTAVYALQSAEKQGQTVARATWALVFATVGLVVATVVLVAVTVLA